MRPNIVYFHTHDTGRWIEPYGAPVRTPAYVRVAEQGVMFRNAHSVAPTCSPSRAGLLTGQCAHSAGMLGLAHRGHRLASYDQHLVRVLRAHGYRTALSGVQHEADGDDAAATIGYDEVLAANGAPAAENAAAAAAFCARDHDRPFFCSVGMVETHRLGRNTWPYGYPPADPDHAAVPAPLPTTPETRRDQASLHAALSAVDAGLGLILDTLAAQGLAERTLVVVTTDHGLPVPEHKGTLSTGGTGVLLLLAGPGVPRGRTTDALVSHTDVVPTVCELAGVEVPAWVQGTSLRPTWEGGAVHEAIFAETNHHVGYQPQRAVRTSRWAYVRRFDDATRLTLADVDDSAPKTLLHEAGWGRAPVESERLYDLLLDPLEQHNLIGDPAHAGTADELRRRLQDWMVATDDPLLAGPIPSPPGIRAATPDDYSPAALRHGAEPAW